MNKKKYMVITFIGIEEVFYFETITEMLEFFNVKDLEELKRDKWIQTILKIEEVIL